MNIDEYYEEALHYLGFRPPEIDTIFDTVSYNGAIDEIDEIENEIESAYNGTFSHPEEEIDRSYPSPPGLETLQDDFTKLLYSVEAFVKVLKDDM
jgi:hypothetical protein